MKKSKYIFSVLLAGCLFLTACGSTEAKNENTNNDATPTAEASQAVFVDHAATLKLDKGTNSAKTEATVKTFVDGDTVHFNVGTDIVDTGLLKARFLAINTPESTGKIEEYGKTASKFTREKLEKATSIILESDDSNWNIDSTGGRYLVWVWYKTAESDEYRNLNIEILQNGLAIASNTGNNRYGSTALAALNTAKECKLNIYSGQKDPNFYYGDSVELTLKEIRLNPENYNGIKVAFEGVITMNSDSSVYIEEYDEETDVYYGILIFYGYGLSGDGLNILKVGNRARIVGTVQYYEAGGSYQVAGLTYRAMKPDDPSNIQKISEGHTGAFRKTTADQFVNGMVTVNIDGVDKSLKYAELAQGSTISMDNLTVDSVYTTTNIESSSYGAMTLNCKDENGVEVQVRTVVLRDDAGNLITEDAYKGKNISVKGIVEYFSGAYQIKVLSKDHITINK